MKKVFTLLMMMFILCGCTEKSMLMPDENKRIYNTYSNMPGYEAKVRMTIYSNNSENVYEMMQYFQCPDRMRSEGDGVVAIVDGKNVAIKGNDEDEPLMLQQVSDESDYMFLNNFFALYYTNEETTAAAASTESEVITLETKTGSMNPYKNSLRLQLSCDTLQPLCLEILGSDKKVYTKIEYLTFKVANPPDEMFVF